MAIKTTEIHCLMLMILKYVFRIFGNLTIFVLIKHVSHTVGKIVTIFKQNLQNFQNHLYSEYRHM